MIDFALDDCSPSGVYSCGDVFVYGGVVDGLDSREFKEGSEHLLLFRQLARRCAPFCLMTTLVALSAQLHRVLQRLINGRVDLLT